MTDIQKILVWAQVGQQLVQIGAGSFTAVKNALKSQGVETDDAQLATLDRLYSARIARREAGPVLP